MEYHQEKVKKRYQDIIIPHFATTGGNNSNYFYCIYRFLIKLREILDIQQKVELLEEKVRNYFEYWLSVCNETLEKQMVDNKPNNLIIYDKIILIIEGIDCFMDPYTNQETIVAFWLPRFFPKNIRLICTGEQTSNTYKYFEEKRCKMIYIPVVQTIVDTMLEQHQQKKLFIDDELKTTHLQILSNIPHDVKDNAFVKVFVSCMLPCPKAGYIEKEEMDEKLFPNIFSKFSYKKIQQSQDCNELLENILHQFENNLIEKKKFQKLLALFKVTQKGLTYEEILSITNITDTEWKLFLVFFSQFFICYQGLWILNNESLKFVIAKYIQQQVSMDDLHEEIANTLEKITPNSIRKLEEQTYHLYKAKKDFKLKEIISTIENFLLLFNPNNKYDFCRFWATLEGKGFDPVIEYNKAIEGFEMHCHPKPEEVFRIIVQISRFLKEFSDFETYLTPAFRHPHIIGNFDDLKDIGLLKELTSLKIFFSKELDSDGLDKLLRNTQKNQTVQEKIKEMQIQKNEKPNDKRAKAQEKERELLEQQANKKSRDQKKLKKQSILDEIESLNIDIPVNKQIFRNHYIQEINKIFQENNHYQVPQEQDTDQSTMTTLPEDLQTMLQQIEQAGQKPDNEFMGFQQLKDYYKQLERMPSNYYYKRWIWIQFPWVCINLKCDYSDKLIQCSSSATQYMSVSEEKQFTRQALKIVIESKKKKQEMYQKKSDVQQKEHPSLLIKSDISRISHVPSLPQIKQTSKSQLNKSQSVSQLQISLDDVNDQGTIKRVSKYGQTTQAQDIKKQQESSGVGGTFFITEDQYMSMNNLIQDIEIQKNSPLTLKNGKIQNSLSNNDINPQNTSKILEKSKVFKDKLQVFDPLDIIQETQKYSTVLPRLQSSINSHSNREIYLLEQQSYLMKKELDFLTSEKQFSILFIKNSKRLAKKLKDLKVIEHSQNRQVNSNLLGVTHQKVEQRQEQINETEYTYYYSILQTERLKKIIKICNDNKKQDEEWIRQLNYLLNNLKKMIKSEKDNIKQSHDEIAQMKKINKSYLEAFIIKMNNHKKLIDQIRRNLDNKKKIDTIFIRSDNLIETSALNQIEKMKTDQKGQDAKKKQQEKQNQLERSKQQMQEQLIQMREQYSQIEQIIDIRDQGYAQHEGYKNFLSALDKKTELSAIIMQKNDKLQDLEATLEERQSYLEVVKQAYGENQQEIEQQEQSEIKDDNENEAENKELQEKINQKLHIMRKLEKVQLQCIMSFQTIQKKLDLQQGKNIEDIMNFETQPITDKLQEYLDIIKTFFEDEQFQKKLTNSEGGPVTYEDFLEGNYDRNVLFKQLVDSNSAYFNHQIAINTQLQNDRDQKYQ